MRLISHTASNTEIVCALGCADRLVGVDADSDFPPAVVQALPQLGRDLQLDVPAVLALKPDLVLTSLTVPGHETVVDQLRAAGCPVLVADPVSLQDVFTSIRDIATALGVPARGEALVAGMEAAMPPVDRPRRPRILVEWWPKPVIVPGRDSWITDLLDRVGAVNPLGGEAHKSRPLEAGEVVSLAPEAVAISWCGVPEHQLRPANVLRRDGWGDTPAVRHARVAAISEAYLGRPGPRLVQGYQHLRRLADAIAD